MARFPYMLSSDAETPRGVWGWAKRLCDRLNKSKLSELDDINLTGKAGYTLKVKADESGFELVP